MLVSKLMQPKTEDWEAKSLTDEMNCCLQWLFVVEARVEKGFGLMLIDLVSIVVRGGVKRRGSGEVLVEVGLVGLVVGVLKELSQWSVSGCKRVAL